MRLYRLEPGDGGHRQLARRIRAHLDESASRALSSNQFGHVCITLELERPRFESQKKTIKMLPSRNDLLLVGVAVASLAANPSAWAEPLLVPESWFSRSVQTVDDADFAVMVLRTFDVASRTRYRLEVRRDGSLAWRITERAGRVRGVSGQRVRVDLKEIGDGRGIMEVSPLPPFTRRAVLSFRRGNAWKHVVYDRANTPLVALKVIQHFRDPHLRAEFRPWVPRLRRSSSLESLQGQSLRMTLSANGRHMVVRTVDGFVHVSTSDALSTACRVPKIDRGPRRVRMCLDNTGRFVAERISYGAFGRVNVYDIDEKRKVAEIRSAEGGPAFSDDSKRLILGAGHLVSTTTWARLKDTTESTRNDAPASTTDAQVFAKCLSPNGKFLAVASRGETGTTEIKVRDIATSQTVRTLSPPYSMPTTGRVDFIVWCPSSRFLVCLVGNGLHMWSVDSGRHVAELDEGPMRVGYDKLKSQVVAARRIESGYRIDRWNLLDCEAKAKRLQLK